MTPPLSIRVSDHILFREVTCRCWASRGGPYCVGGMVDRELMYAFEGIREQVGVRLGFEQPIIISSGYRCPRWNTLQPESSPTSFHLHGRAIDMRLPNRLTHREFLEDVTEVWGRRGGILLYDWGIHIDLGSVRFLNRRENQ